MVAILPEAAVKSCSRSNSYPALRKLDVPSVESRRACNTSVRPSKKLLFSSNGWNPTPSGPFTCSRSVATAW